MADEPETDVIEAVTVQAVDVPTAATYRDYATQLILPGFSYEELVEYGLESWRESADRVARALVEERRAGLLLDAG